MRFLINRSACIAVSSIAILSWSIGVVAHSTRGDEAGLREIPQAFAPFEYLVGRWKGQATPKDRSAKQFRGWPETHEWAWIFEKGKPVGLSVTITGGKVISTGKLTFDAGQKRYRLEGTEPKLSGGPIAFEGAVTGTAKQLVLDRVAVEGKSSKMRLILWPNPNFIRYTIKLERQEPGAVQLSPAIEVGLTKEGESLAGGDGAASESPKCIVTGGSATMTLTFQGKTFPICCTGCRDEFNESPEKYIKKASLLNASSANTESNQPAATRVSRFEDAFASDIPAASNDAGQMGDKGGQAAPSSAPDEAKDKIVSKANKAAENGEASKRANRAATLLRIAQNLEKDGKTEVAMKNYRQIVKDFAGTPAAKSAAERIKSSTNGSPKSH